MSTFLDLNIQNTRVMRFIALKAHRTAIFGCLFVCIFIYNTILGCVLKSNLNFLLDIQDFRYGRKTIYKVRYWMGRFGILSGGFKVLPPSSTIHHSLFVALFRLHKRSGAAPFYQAGCRLCRNPSLPLLLPLAKRGPRRFAREAEIILVRHI